MPKSTDNPRSESGTPTKVKSLDPKPAPAPAKKLTLHKRDPWSGRSG
jgi:hypothetical protein